MVLVCAGMLAGASVARAEEPSCYECHDSVTEGKAVLHEPAADGDCLACHEDHGDEERLMLVAKGAALCSECHDDYTKGKAVHTPVADGDCTDCHNPHGSPNAKMLVAKGAALCSECHDAFEGKSVHTPVADGDCGDCHDPHSSGNPMLVRAMGAALCSECHDDYKAGKSVHSPVAGGACTVCHAPHSSPQRKLLKDSSPELCQKCHAKSPAFEGRVAHTALDDGCSGCHEPHRSDNEKLLTKRLLLDRLAVFEPGQADLCLDCHDLSAFTALEGEDTGFRMGQKNLHTLHLLGGGGVPNKYGIVKKKDGQTCYACHLPHTAHQEMLMRTEYACTGALCYTMRFVKNEQGGTCIVGCHKPRTYNREGQDRGARAGLAPVDVATGRQARP